MSDDQLSYKISLCQIPHARLRERCKKKKNMFHFSQATHPPCLNRFSFFSFLEVCLRAEGGTILEILLVTTYPGAWEENNNNMTIWQTNKQYRVSLKKGTFLIWFLFLFQKSDFTFSHVFWNQNFEPVSFSHSNNAHSEYELHQKRMHICVKLVGLGNNWNCLSLENRLQQCFL